MADETIRNESVTLLPEYQENFAKDLFRNIYYTDPKTGQVSGLAAQSPLYGQRVLDEQGNPVYETDNQGNIRYDIRGNPIEKVLGGVPKAEIMPFTPAQQRALELGVQGIGAYGPMMQQAEGTYQQGISALQGSLGAFSPTAYKDFYNPFVEEVIKANERDIDRAGGIERRNIAAGAVNAGAFGGSRQAVAEQELARNLSEQKATMGSQLRSNAYTAAQQQAQSVFENQMQRGQNAAQVFQGLGTSQGALGEAAQAAAQRDVNSLFNVGSLEQAQRQSEYDVQRANAIETMYEPYNRFNYMSDILRGVPSSGSTLAVSSTPSPSPVSGILGTAMQLGSYASQFGGGQGILGSLTNPSGA